MRAFASNMVPRHSYLEVDDAHLFRIFVYVNIVTDTYDDVTSKSRHKNKLRSNTYSARQHMIFLRRLMVCI